MKDSNTPSDVTDELMKACGVPKPVFEGKDDWSGYVQTVRLLLDDGRSITYSGRVQLLPGIDDNRKIVEVLIAEPIKLPEGCRFEEYHSGADLPVEHVEEIRGSDSNESR